MPHRFNELEVKMLCPTIGTEAKQEVFEKFLDIVEEKGLFITTPLTDATFITHEINCDEEEFNELLQLTKDSLGD